MSAGSGAQEVSGGKFGKGGVAQKGINLNLTPMIDLFTILIVFLVSSYAADPSFMANAKDIELSNIKLSSEKPQETSVISVSPHALLLDGKQILPVIVNPKDGQFDFPDSAYAGFTLPDLFDALKVIADNAMAIEKINPSRPFKKEILLHADRGVPFAVLKPVLRTTGNAGFRNIKIAAKGLN